MCDLRKNENISSLLRSVYQLIAKLGHPGVTFFKKQNPNRSGYILLYGIQ